MDQIILSWEDSLLRKRDVDTLEEGNWIIDVIFDFYFQYLSLKVYPDWKEVFFLSPSLVHLIVDAVDPRYIISALPPEFTKMKVIWIPVNNQRSELAGGTHWSCVLFLQDVDKFYCFDSNGSMNRSHTIQTCKSVHRLLHQNNEKQVNIEYVSSPQQTNGNDCGIYVLMCITEICKMTSKSNENWATVLSKLTREGLLSYEKHPSSMRKYLKSLIESLK